MTSNTKKITQFIKKNSKPVGYWVTYVYTKQYIVENKRGEHGIIKNYDLKVRRWVKNGIVNNKIIEG